MPLLAIPPAILASSSTGPPRVEEHGPFDDIARDENTSLLPGVVAKESRRLLGIARFHDDEHAAEICVWPGQDNPPLLEQTVHEGGMLVPERLLASGHTRHPRGPRLAKDKEERAHCHAIPHRRTCF